MTRALALLLLLGTAPLARAQEDAPIPYPDDPAEAEADAGRPAPRRRLPPVSEPTYVPRTENRAEREDRELQLASLDDPNVGLGFELTGGLLLLEASRGSLVEPRLALGARAVWELGRWFWAESIRDGLFVDLGYSFASLRDGTQLIFADTSYHYVTAAPAFGAPIFGKDFLVYGQVGGGVAVQHSALHYDARESTVTGVKPVLQYGLGLRGRPAVSADGRVRVAFRIELTRYRRHYMDDTFLGASVGAVF